MIAWVTYAVVVAAFLSAAAWSAETVARSRGLPTRAPWAVALVASLAMPLQALLRPSPPLPTSHGAGMAPEKVAAWIQELGAGALPASGWAESIRPWLLGGWGAASAVLALAVLGGLAILAGRARRWPSKRVAGQTVLVSDGFGPAVLGVFRPRVVVPDWMTALEPARLDMVVIHEDEHRRSGDSALLLAGTLAAVAAPWNPLLWWQLARLRAAVEVDCDRRVLRRGVAARPYGRLLLDLSSRARPLALPVAALARPRSLLERRLTMITRPSLPGRRAALVAAASCAALVAVACETPAPTALDAAPPPPAASVDATSDADAGPTPAEAEAPLAGRIMAVPDAPSDVTAEPVIYVDGVRAEGKSSGVIRQLAPDDIDRIEVLKGAAAARLFGSEAEGGVIQVFTKAGGGGAASGGAGTSATIRQLTKGAAASGDGSASGGTIAARKKGVGGVLREAPAKASGGGGAVGGTLRARSMDLGEDIEAMRASGKARVFVDGALYEGPMSSLKERIERVEIVHSTDGSPAEVRIVSKAGAGGG